MAAKKATTKAIKYADRIADENAAKENSIAAAVANAELQIDKKIQEYKLGNQKLTTVDTLTAKDALAKAEAAVEKAKNVVPFDLKAIEEAWAMQEQCQETLDNLEERAKSNLEKVERLENLKSELF